MALSFFGYTDNKFRAKFIAKQAKYFLLLLKPAENH